MKLYILKVNETSYIILSTGSIKKKDDIKWEALFGRMGFGVVLVVEAKFYSNPICSYFLLSDFLKGFLIAFLLLNHQQAFEGVGIKMNTL